jgi:type I restriction enzyme S subunit
MSASAKKEMSILEKQEGYKLGKVKDLISIRNGYAFKSNDFRDDDGIPVIRQTNLSTDTVNFDRPKFLPKEFLDIHNQFVVRKGDVLIGLSGSIGNLSTYREDFLSLQNQRTGLLVEKVPGSRRYVEYFLKSIKNQLNEVAKGVAVQNISSKQIEEWPIPIATPEQQKQIVAKIEELFSHIDAGIDALKQSKKLLKQYRQSVLKAAVTGELSKEWREQNKDKLEPASKLLERILQERRQKWEAQQLEQFKAKGKVPKDDGWKAKYETPLQAKELDLPEGWATTSIDQLTHFVTSGSRGWADYYSEAGSLFIRAQNIKYDRLDLDDIAYVDLPVGAEGLRTKVSLGDLLITITGANVTKSALVDKVLDDAYVSQHVALCRIIDPELSAYVHLYVVCQHGGRRILEKAAYGAGKPGLNLENVRSLPVPLPSLTEISVIQAEVENKLFAIASMESSIDLELKRSEQLKQSVLQSAFGGDL